MANDVLIEVQKVAVRGDRQIAAPHVVTEELEARREDIEAALDEVISLGRKAMEKAAPSELGVTSVEITFGLKLTAEAGVIVSKVGAEASLEITVKVERVAGAGT
ncbi:CU044_2847 family protein [Pedococcus sp. 2YAF34]|uniref:CU044_2847 family protein n=1 Tax=Pedococcus sp. 2YAF34 TaxID=3233032 RepID=UPI003F9BBE14